MSGYATNAGLIHIVCDPDSPRLNDPERGQRVASTVAHELHHAARNQGPGYGKTLGEALVSEGLAQAFEVEMTGVTPFYAVALAPHDLSALATRALPELDKLDYDHQRWFFGDKPGGEFEMHGGYSLGFSVVAAWLRIESKTAAGATRVPSSTILDAWREGKIVVGTVFT